MLRLSMLTFFVLAACGGSGSDAICGDGTCAASEDETSCPDDCNSTCGNDCTANDCGDDFCAADENSIGCPEDCGDDATCGQVLASTTAGDTCDQNTAGDCGDAFASACLMFNGAGSSTCYQVCLQGTCEQRCRADESCLSVTDSNGDPVELAPGVELGVCDVVAAGDRTEFQSCTSADGACAADLDCFTITGAAGGPWCFPRCDPADSSCADVSGNTPQCILGTGSNCALTCDSTVTPDTCPAGLVCTPTGGTDLCLSP